jgi:phosphoglycerate kinase
MIRHIGDLDCAHRRVFVRADLNVPLTAESHVADRMRIDAFLPTLRFLLEQKARVIVASHLGRPKGQVNHAYSLLPVAEVLTEILSQELIFPESCVGGGLVKLSHDMEPGSVVLLENLRFVAGEEKNDPQFSENLAALGDVYVNDAFGTLHRAHASTVGMVGHFQEKYAGFLVEKEIKELRMLSHNPKRPFLAIIGGAKVSDKIHLIEKFLDRVDSIILGGGLAYTFLKAQGYAVGSSKLEEEVLHVAERILQKAKRKGVTVLLPCDHLATKKIGVDAQATLINKKAIPDGLIALDIGPHTREEFKACVADANTIFWNGPLGFFEIPAFSEGTRSIAQAVAESDAHSVIGGGDSALALNSLGIADKVSHISTGGGASLAYLEGRTLPGLHALEV